MYCLVRFYRNVKRKKSISMHMPQIYFLSKFVFSTWKMSVRESGREANPFFVKTKSFVSLISTISKLSTFSILTAWHSDFPVWLAIIPPTELSPLCFEVWSALVYECSKQFHASDLQFPSTDIYVSSCNTGLKSWPHWNQWESGVHFWSSELS